MGLFNSKKKGVKEEESKEEEDRMEQGYFLHIEQEVEQSERKQMHNERDEDMLDADREPKAPDETGIDKGEDAEREAGSSSLSKRKKKTGTSGEDKRPMK